MFRKIAFLIILTLSTAMVTANPKQIRSHADSFSLSRRVYVIAHKSEKQASTEVVGILSNVGVGAVGATSPMFKKSKIILKRVVTIEGISGKDALKITVSADRVDVTYTTEESKRRAMEYLRRIVKSDRIEGFDISDWAGGTIQPRGLIFDAASQFEPMIQIENYAKNVKGKDIFVRFVDSENWRLETTVFALVNPNEKIYPAGGYYRIAQIKELAEKISKQNRATLVPVLDFMSANTPFRKVTGHEINSVEGMRFVRAILEELHKNGFKKICVGSLNDDYDKRFVQFMNDIADRNGIELIYK